MALHNDLGKRGEQLAKTYLEQKRYIILQQSWNYQRAEIDLIAKKLDIIVFVEVKTRTGDFFGYPEEAVTPRKQHLIQKAAEEFIHISGHEGPCRFDIISITFDKNNHRTPRVYHIEDAFF